MTDHDSLLAPAPPPPAGPAPMDLAAMSLGKQRIVCKYCHQPGHWARDLSGKATCPVLIKNEADAAAAAAR